MLPQTLYVSRQVLNAPEILAWFSAQGVSPMLTPDDLHVTIAFSRAPVMWDAAPIASEFVQVANIGERVMDKFGNDKEALVMKFTSGELLFRWEQFRLNGASWEWLSYQPHITLSYSSSVDPNSLRPFEGIIRLGPEIFKELNTEWTASVVEKSHNIDDALVISVPAIIKSRMENKRRIIEVEASNETVDMDGDVILQKALLASASDFLAKGHLDLDHLSEFGYRMGIQDPTSYIIGRPLEVKDVGKGRTSVVGEIRHSIDGISNPRKNKYDDFWESMQSSPPVRWQASVFGYPKPGMMRNCQEEVCDSDATRFLVEGFDWCSLALTRTPKNLGLTGNARIVTAKSFMADMAKAMGVPGTQPRSMGELWAARNCIRCHAQVHPSTVGYREHYAKCLGVPDSMADIFAHAVMHKTNKMRFSN